MSEKLEIVGKFAEKNESCQNELTDKNAEQQQQQIETATNVEQNYVANKIKSMRPKAALDEPPPSDAVCSDEHATAEATPTTTSTLNTDTTDNITKPASDSSYKFKEPAAPSSTTSTSSATSTSYQPTTTPTTVATPTTKPSATAVLKKTPSDFVFGKCIGEGSFSSVYLALGRQDRREYAIKVCDKRHILRERKQVYVRREREVLQVMSHTPGFVNLICTFQDNRSLYFVMTFAPNGELFPHIKRVGCFSVECARHYAAELVLACEQMHRRHVVHRDLKPENILLDARMHTLIADFGSAKLLTEEEIEAAVATYDAPEPPTTPSPSSSATSLTRYDDCDDVFFGDDVSGGGESQPQRYRHKRKGSFVGTAQYVSPEVLQNLPIMPAADLWALGCIIYHMIAGMPPFRGYNDFAIFKEILAANFEFPENFDEDGEALVRLLLKMKPTERLGARDELTSSDNNGAYVSIRSHAFFAGIDFENLRQQPSPQIRPRLPTFGADDDEIAALDDASKCGSLVNELAAAWKYVCNATEIEGNAAEKQRLLDVQKSDKWHYFTENEIILKRGLVNRHKGLFATKLMLLLTTGPQLIYVDPVEMIKKGKINWGNDLRAEIGNRRLFYVHTTLRTHFFEVLEGSADDWVERITKIHDLCFVSNATRSKASLTSDSPTSLSLSSGNSFGLELDATLMLQRNEV